ncbi:MAG: hypothetical protein ABI303_03595 [Candidatus Saccharimonas sp.]
MKSTPHREKILDLRLEGYTYAEINQILGTSYPKSTLSTICSGHQLSIGARTRLQGVQLKAVQANQAKALIANRNIQEQRFAAARIAAARITKGLKRNSLKLALAMLYWGEGSKRNSYRGLSLGNSDSHLLRTYIYLLEECYGLNHADFKARIQCRADQDTSKLLMYWSNELSIKPQNFYRTYIDQRTVGKITTSDYKGVCVISHAGADIQLELAEIAKTLIS